ncbi:MAG: lipocalin-like domain-containing protein [Saprospiraceae bacterium]|nr:lipocalin-like domain-containing protein [Saprospiraceae bacterium]
MVKILVIFSLGFGINLTTEMSPVLGSWSMREVHWISTDTTYSIHNTQPGIFIFTPKSYAIMWTPSQQPRRAFEVLSKPTDEEILDGFRSVVFNAGSYVWTDSTLISTAVIAKVPGFEGGKQYYRYQIEHGILTLVMFDETYPDGSKPEWSGRYVTKFILEKIDS